MKKDSAKKGTAAKCPFRFLFGSGGETHQQRVEPGEGEMLTTNQGVVLSDNQNSLKIGARGPTLLEDFILREKITHFDHERIPERIVHARGSGAHGVFQPYRDFSDITRAKFLRDPKKKTEVFARFSTVAGGAGSGDLPRDVRGFAVKFYTEEGNFDLVGNNIPVFFIQDAMKFPDLVHSVKMEPDRGFPQAASAHDTFWDFVSLMPESMHMLTWAMSDRAIPRSLRMIEGFGVNTFRFVNEKNRSNFVKFHWRPMLQASSVMWDEAVKINGADPDFHRRDLWQAIEKGDFPEWEFSVQIFDEKMAAKFPFDVLDPTKVIPEELVPLTPLGKMTLNRNPDNFFAETEQIAFHPGHVVPGIDFSNDPLLQGRLHSYLDTHLSRLGGANFHEIPINRPRCPIRNFQRDGLRRIDVPKGRVAYEPNTLAPESARENPVLGFRSFEAEEETEKLRIRPESFADHYSQARMFYRSNNPVEQEHIQNAFAFELGKVETVEIRRRMLGHLLLIDSELGRAVEEKLGMKGEAEKIKAFVAPTDMKPSPSLSILKKFKPTVQGRKAGIVLGDGFDDAMLKSLQAAFTKEKCAVELIAPVVAGARAASGTLVPVHHALAGAPSVFFDYLAVLASESSLQKLQSEPAFKNWVRDGYDHKKPIAVGVAKAGGVQLLDLDLAQPGMMVLTDGKAITRFVDLARQGRFWERV